MSSALQDRKAFVLAPGALVGQSSDPDRFSHHLRFVGLAHPPGAEWPLGSLVQRETQRRLEESASQRIEGEPGKDILPDGAPGNSLFGASDIGVVFVERTRIRPSGFAVGEHLFSLSLAPGEEVTIEQRTYSERQQTYEELTERESTDERELSSSLTTELTNSLQKAMNESRADQQSVGGSLSASYEGIGLSVSAGQQTSLNTADTTTRNESVKKTRAAAEKLSAKFRSQHRVSFRLSETSKFENSRKRVLRNANPFTPVDLVYFKIYQRQQLSHERHGVRYCWAPFVKDPGAISTSAIARKQKELESKYPEPPKPALRPKPTPPAGPNPMMVSLGLSELTRWGFWGDMRHDYVFTLFAPQGFEWDGDTSKIEGSLSVMRDGWSGRPEPNVYIVAAAADGANGVKVIVHAGVDVGFAGAHLWVNLSARFQPTVTGVPDASYLAALNQWLADEATWRATIDANNAARKAKIKAELDLWTVEYWKSFDPVSAAMRLLVSQLLPPSARNEGAEIEMWNQIFEFDSAQIMLYPAWWSETPPRDPVASPTSFANASWARLFLPIRVGFEKSALEWLLAGNIELPATSPLKPLITSLVDEIEQYRMATFGDPREVVVTADTTGVACPKVSTRHVCLGTWEEILPTDGTHVEVLQANTTAVDDLSLRDLDRQSDIQSSTKGSLDSDAALKTAVANVTAGTPTTVVLNIGEATSTKI